MEPKKKGRPSQDKLIRPYSLDRKIAEFIDSLPDGDRSRFVNNILIQGITVEKLSGKFYNYVLIRSNGSVFYVGKGQGNRIDQHEEEAKRGIQSHKCNIIRQEWANGEQIIKQKVAFHDNEEDAYELEILLISFFGRENLANGTDGGEGGPGRMPLPEGQKAKRVNVTLFPDTLWELEAKVPLKQRSAYIERLVRADLGLPELKGVE